MMPFDQSNSESVLFVGLVCIDNFFVVEKYPEEDSDQPASEAFKARGGNHTDYSPTSQACGIREFIFGF